MKDATVVIIALVVAGTLASALIIPQVVASQFSSARGSSGYVNGNPEVIKGVSGMMSPTNSNMGQGSGMMGSRSMMSPETYGDYTRAHGMMGGDGMMGPSVVSGMHMMNGMMGYYSEVPVPLSHEDAEMIAVKYLKSLNNPDLIIDEFEEYSHNFYVSIVEKSAERGAFEVIIDRYGGSIQAEPQSMMWNAKYGMMSGSRGAEMTVTTEQAMKIAQDFVDVVFPGTKADEIVTYYGYYTVMTALNGEHYGMLSVNGFSGEVWYHTWHGMFISEVE